MTSENSPVGACEGSPATPMALDPEKRLGKAVRGCRATLKGGPPSPIVEPDGTWPGMFRVRLVDGSLSDMANFTRANDAARILQDGHER